MHFPGLHALRFFAALAVVVAHIELMKSYYGVPSLAGHMAIYELGRIAVTFFFVLSGFLITFLLLRERRDTGVIAVRKFYMRRILRIWPLYYLVVFLAFVVLPRIESLSIPALSTASADQGPVLGLFLLFMPQVALIFYPPFPYAEPLWSIGVEEQFYLLWPLLLARARNTMAVAVTIAVAGFAIKAGALLYAMRLRDPSRLAFWNHFIDYFYFNRFECMAIGACGACLVFAKQERVLRVLFSTPLQVVSYAVAVALLMTTRGKPILQYTPHSVVFCIIIMNIAANESSLLKLRAPFYTRLGNISYAMYLLHEVAIGAVMRLIRAAGVSEPGVAANAALYFGGITATLVLAAVAYRFFELPFLRLKDRYTVIGSGPDRKPGIRPEE